MHSGMNFWDQNFSIPGYKYGTEPNAFLTQQACRLAPNSQVLVPGDGEGRNGVWLARQGHRVTAMDGSAVGLQKAQALAKQHGVEITTVVGDLADWVPAPGAFDAVVLTYVHLPAAIRAGAHRRIARALRPGGWLILEAFHPLQLRHSSGGPKDPAMLYALDTVRADFAELLEEVEAWEGECELAEGSGHQGTAHVTRWVGRRPEAQADTA